MADSKRISLRVVLTLDVETMSWLARCVEYNIVSSGKTIRAAQWNFVGCFIAQLIADAQDGRAPLADVPPAPPEVEERFLAGQRLGDLLNIDLPRASLPSDFVLDARLQEVRICA